MTRDDVEAFGGLQPDDFSADAVETLEAWQTHYNLGGPRPAEAWEAMIGEYADYLTDGDEAQGRVLARGRAVSMGQYTLGALPLDKNGRWFGYHVLRDKSQETEYNREYYKTRAAALNAKTKQRRVSHRSAQMAVRAVTVPGQSPKKKMCERCGVEPRQIPDRERAGPLIRRICWTCHRALGPVRKQA